MPARPLLLVRDHEGQVLAIALLEVRQQSAVDVGVGFGVHVVTRSNAGLDVAPTATISAS